MAVAIESLTFECTTDTLQTDYEKLNDDNISFEDRLSISKQLYSFSLDYKNKVLSWYAESLQNGEVEMDVKEKYYETLLTCLKTDRENDSINLDQTTVTKVIKILKHGEDNTDKLKLFIRNCTVELIRTKFFSKFYSVDVISASKLIANYFSSISSEASCECITEILNCYWHMFHITSDKSCFRSYFIKRIMIPMCVALQHAPENQSEQQLKKLYRLFGEVLFCEPNFINNYIASNVSKDIEPTEEIKKFNKRIKLIPIEEGVKAVDIFYSSLLKSVIYKYPENYEQAYRIFILLSARLGIIVNRTRSVEMNPVNNWLVDNSFVIIMNLVDILDVCEVPTNVHLEEVSLDNWFTGLVIGLTFINTGRFSVKMLKMFSKVFEFNPSIIIPASRALSTIMLQIKNPDVMETFLSLMRTIFVISSDDNKLFDFIQSFLSNINEFVRDDSHLILKDVLPEEVFDCFGKAAATQPVTNTIYFWKQLLFHLNIDCLKPVESYQFGIFVCIKMEIISNLINQMIKSVSIFDHSVENSVKDEFKYILETLQKSLRDFGLVFHQIYEDQIMEPYLSLCECFGYIKLLIRDYENNKIEKTDETDLIPTNLYYVHNYLSPNEWVSINENVETYGNLGSKHQLYRLMVQKIEAVAQVEEGSDGPGTKVARYLLDFADSEWLSDNMFKLSRLFQSAELALLVEKIDNDKLLLLVDGNYDNNMRFMLVIGLHIMKKGIENLYDKDEDSIGSIVISSLDVTNHLEYELSELITADDDLKELIENSLDNIAFVLNKKINKKPSIFRELPSMSVFEVPSTWELEKLSTLNQRCLLIMALTIIYQLQPESEANIHMFKLLFKLMEKNIKNKTFFGKLKPEIILRFVAERGERFFDQKQLMKMICCNALGSSETQENLIQNVRSPLPQDLWLTAVVVMSIRQFEDYLNEEDMEVDNEDYMKRKENIKELVISSMFPLICEIEPIEQHLYSYSVVFWYVIDRSEKLDYMLAQLLPNLQKYLEFAEADYKLGDLLLKTVIKHRDDLEDNDFPPFLISRTWRHMLSDNMTPSEEKSHLIFTMATPEEYTEMLTVLLEDTKIQTEKGNINNQSLFNLLHFWCHLATDCLNVEKESAHMNAITQLVQTLILLSERWTMIEKHYEIPIILTFMSMVTTNTLIPLESNVLEAYLNILKKVPMPTSNNETLVKRLELCLDVMSGILLRYLQMNLNVPIMFFKVYCFCMKKLTFVKEDFVDVAVHNLKKLLKILLQRKRDDLKANVSDFLIYIMKIFVHCNLVSSVELFYNKIVKKLISICNEENIDEILHQYEEKYSNRFRVFYENYNRY